MTGHRLDSSSVRAASSATTPQSTGRPVRTCVGCRERAQTDVLLRMVVRNGCVVVDEGRSLTGRGAWLHPDPACLSRAERRRAWPRAFRVTTALDVTPVRDRLGRTAG